MKPSLLNAMYVLNTKQAYKFCYFPGYVYVNVYNTSEKTTTV